MKIILMALFSLMMAACDNAPPPATTHDTAEKLSVITASAARHDFVVEIALTPEQQRDGLMHRTEMPDNAGMLFVFGTEDERSFWMKNTLISLDIIFIAKNGVITHIHENAVPEDLTPILSNGPAAAVLELNGGMAKKLNIKPGDKIHSIFFGNSLAK